MVLLCTLRIISIGEKGKAMSLGMIQEQFMFSPDFPLLLPVKCGTRWMLHTKAAKPV